MKTKKILLLATTGLLFVACNDKSDGKPGFGNNEYAVRTVTTGNTELETTYPATIRGVQDVEIRPKVSGFITKVCVREGESVKAGQLLFVIDNETYQAQVRQASGAVNTAKAQLETARLTKSNSEKLHKSNVIGDYELATAQNNYATAEAALAQAEAALASAKQTLDYCFIKSPTSGVIGTLPYKAGALVSATGGQPLTTVSDISSVEVYFSVTEKDMLRMTREEGGMKEAIKTYPPVRLRLADGTIYADTGKIIKASGVIDERTGTITLIARFDNKTHMLRSGGAGQIIVPNISSASIIVPQEAVAEIQNKNFMYLVDKDNKVRYTEIKVLPQNDGSNYIVIDGIKVGDQYVSKGIASLNDGMEIKPISETEYLKKINDAAELGKNQNSASGFIDAMKK